MRNYLHKFILVATLLLYACTSAKEQPGATAFTPVVTSNKADLLPTESAAEPISVKSTTLLCDQTGRFERYQIVSKLLNGPLFFSVYFPPCYSDIKDGGYPVLYALHGQNFTDEMWKDLGIGVKVDRLVQSGEIKPFLIVMPYEEFCFRDVEKNKFPLTITNEIIPWVEKTLNVCSERSCRALGGISRGAAWAMRIGLVEWDLFGAIGAHSLPPFHGYTENLPDWLENIPYGEEPRIYLDSGRFDPEIKATCQFEQILNAKGIPHEWHLNEGRHNELYWQENMEDYIRWYARGWK
ncbi:MAG: hypothetical protein J7L66_04160 [Anaerolineaceae bacterium]|nr:hypothetical protein [Anaerolineaceae bacterium]